MHQFDQHDSYWVTRYKIGTALFTPHGKPLSLMTLLAEADQGLLDCPIQPGAEIRLPCRLVAEAGSAEELRKRQKHLRHWERKHQRRASAEKWALLAWTT